MKLEAVCSSELSNCQKLVANHLNIPNCGNPKFQQFITDTSIIFYCPETDRQMDTPKEHNELIYTFPTFRGTTGAGEKKLSN
jgi:hypothetical protein